MYPSTLSKSNSGRSSFGEYRAKGQFNPKRRVLLYRRIASALDAGKPLMSIIGITHSNYVRDKRALRHMTADWTAKITDGTPLSDAMRGWVPEAELVLVGAGEASGGLSRGLKEAANVTEAMIQIKGALIAALAYPVFMLAMLIGMFILGAYYILPTMVQMLPLDQWPGFALVFHDTTEFLKSQGVYVLGSMAALTVLTSVGLPRMPHSRVRAFLDRYYPPFMIYRQITSATFLISLSAQVSAGITVQSAIETLDRLASKYAKSHYGRMIQLITAGKDPGPAVKTGLLTMDIVDDVDMYASGGEFDVALNHLGATITKDTVDAVKKASGIVTIAMLFLVAGNLMWMMGSLGMLAMSISDKATGL